jgi:hypothetical protein
MFVCPSRLVNAIVSSQCASIALVFEAAEIVVSIVAGNLTRNVMSQDHIENHSPTH